VEMSHPSIKIAGTNHQSHSGVLLPVCLIEQSDSALHNNGLLTELTKLVSQGQTQDYVNSAPLNLLTHLFTAKHIQAGCSDVVNTAKGYLNN